jgi:hypothetical protein
MFSNYNGKLRLIISMGVVSAILTSISSAVIISYILKIHNKVTSS